MPERILTLLVNDHPGALLHVLGLLARRGFRATAMSAAPSAPGRQRVVLHVADDGRIARLEHELRRLHDVHEVADVTPDPSGGAPLVEPPVVAVAEEWRPSVDS